MLDKVNMSLEAALCLARRHQASALCLWLADNVDKARIGEPVAILRFPVRFPVVENVEKLYVMGDTDFRCKPAIVQDGSDDEYFSAGR